ncbi:site-specific DNA-methyltransferase [Mycobacteroides abscessus]|nr:site-specific DNA-methyltransferase [Mycobacteroides abscessus]MDM2133369.1 site-specific DNA-methyltransferase [Mycobacteroides abscessus]MDM2145060.1 site-specific DNA-methyltransferase [Mycobacteroides abscessus]MDM2153169.1 site-specific DNA-methyltransferase [Mycobacteroides abscessus]MDM2182202.1 site-specific DNA-methyltransferase [Mycobacteroides abscessus]
MITPYFQDDSVTLHHGDALEVAKTLPDGAADCIVTSPPYFALRDYGEPGQYGLEASPADYVETMRALFAELRRVLAADGTLWLNLGDSYSAAGGHTDPGGTSALQGRRVQLMQNMPTKGSDRPAKNMLGMPWRVAFALQDDGWILRNDIIWHKPNAMPESVTDRLSGRHEHVFMFSKSPRYWFDLDAVREQYDGDRDTSRRARSGRVNKTNSVRTSWVPPESPPTAWNDQSNMGATGRQHTWTDKGGRNPGDVWEIPTQPFPGAHFAVMASKLAQRCIAAGCKPGGTVLDPFSGSGTTGMAAQRLGHKYIGIDLKAEYLELSLRTRLQAAPLDFEAGA